MTHTPIHGLLLSDYKPCSPSTAPRKHTKCNTTLVSLEKPYYPGCWDLLSILFLLFVHTVFVVLILVLVLLPVVVPIL